MSCSTIHLLGDYCANGTRLRANCDRVVEPKDAIEPDPLLRWRWRRDLCGTCTTRGGVGLFNRAVHERREFESGKEAPAVVRTRLDRLEHWGRVNAAQAEKAREKAERKAERAKRAKERVAAWEAKRAERRKKSDERAARHREREKRREAAAINKRMGVRTPRAANDTRAAGAP